MNGKTKRWIYGLGSAVIGGGASAVTSGMITMGFAPDKFNLSSMEGLTHLFGLMVANFLVSGFLSGMYYLKQSPLPPEDTQFIPKP